MKPGIVPILVLLALSPFVMAYHYGGYPPQEPTVPNYYSLALPIWSPDGETILFGQPNTARFVRNDYVNTYEKFRIFVAASDGSSLHSVSVPSDVDPFASDFSPAVSPDGRRVAFATLRHSAGHCCADIGTAALDGSDYQRLTDDDSVDDFNPSWSPDGTRIAFLSWREPPGIYIMAADGSDERVVVPDATNLGVTYLGGAPAWSPDSRWIAFIARADNLEGEEPELIDQTRALYIYVAAPDGSDVRRISRASTPPVWSPDGSSLAFGKSEGNFTKFYTVRPDGTGMRELPGLYQDSVDSLGPDAEGDYGGEWNLFSLSWVPSGSEISFLGTRYDTARNGSYRTTVLRGIHAMKPDGSDIRTIAELPSGSNVVMAWSPDGSRIAVRIIEDEPRGVFREDPPPNVLLFTLAADGSDRLDLVRGGWVLEAAPVAEHSGWRDVNDDITACSKGFVVPDPDENPGLVQDCETLLRVRNALAGEDVILEWSAAIPITDWIGVHVSEDSMRVQSLDLAKGLRGVIPGELDGLTELESLWLEGLSGPIPPELGNLNNLRVLRLRLYGTTRFFIPPQLGRLTSLVELNLSQNRLRGEIPLELGKLANLEELYLQGNELTGEIPPELGSLTNLVRLSLDNNRLTGEIPPELGNLTNLERLSLNDNLLTGEIPPELGRPENLRQLYVEDLYLKGCIPPELSQKDLRMFKHDGLAPC